jgi:hypothetical protein
MIWLELFMVLYSFFALLIACSLLLGALAGIPYVPSKISTVEKVFRQLKLPPHTRLVDLGSGDGRVVLLAATKFGWDAVGVEINAAFNCYARIRQLLSHAHSAAFKTSNLLSEPLTDYQVVFIYGFPAMMKKLQPKLRRDCRPGTWIISNSFILPGEKPIFSVEDTFAYRI